MTLYLDSNATTRIDPRVREAVNHYLEFDYGNASSPHEFGERAKEAVQAARDAVGKVVRARRHEVIFTSGATESNNLAILGLAEHGRAVGKRHIVSTRVEHKAVLEPLEALEEQGFEVTLVAPNGSGRVDAGDVLSAVREDTLLVSIMDANNETGVCQPVPEIADGLADKNAFLHVDAAQGFGKEIEPLRHGRVDLISVSGHKIHGPQGVGALVARRRKRQPPPLRPLFFGGGQELGLRPGTLPVALIAGFGEAARLALCEWRQRRVYCERLRAELIDAFVSLSATVHGEPHHALPHVLNASFPGVASDQVVDVLRGVAAVSDGAACTTICPTNSHVLTAMGVAGAELDGAVRFSWSHLTPAEEFQWALPLIVERIATVGRG